MVAILLLKKTTIYTEDTIDIRHHKETKNSNKYDIQASARTQRTREKYKLCS